jgi:hypothetical protein
LQGARFSGGGMGLSLLLSKIEGEQALCFSIYGTDDADDAEGRRRQTTAFDSMPRSKHAKIEMCVL